MWVRYDSAVTPLFCRQRLYIQQMYSTLTDNRQNGQKQIGQIHLFNLLLPNLPIDFILVDNIGQRIPPVAPERTQGWVNERQTQQSDLPVLIHALRAVLFDRYHQIINPNLWLLICPPILVAGLFCLPNLFNIHQKHHLFTKTKQIFCIFPPFYLHIWKISRIFAEKNNNMTVCQKTGWLILKLHRRLNH